MPCLRSTDVPLGERWLPGGRSPAGAEPLKLGHRTSGLVPWDGWWEGQSVLAGQEMLVPPPPCAPKAAETPAQVLDLLPPKAFASGLSPCCGWVLALSLPWAGVSQHLGAVPNGELEGLCRWHT